MKVVYQELKAADECPYRQPVYDKYGNLKAVTCGLWHEETSLLICEPTNESGFPEFCLLPDDEHDDAEINHIIKSPSECPFFCRDPIRQVYYCCKPGTTGTRCGDKEFSQNCPLYNLPENGDVHG